MAHLLKLLIEKTLDLLDTIYRCPIAVGSSVGSSAGVHSHLFSREHDSMHRDAMLGKVGGDAVAVKPLHSIIFESNVKPRKKKRCRTGPEIWCIVYPIRRGRVQNASFSNQL